MRYRVRPSKLRSAEVDPDNQLTSTWTGSTTRFVSRAIGPTGGQDHHPPGLLAPKRAAADGDGGVRHEVHELIRDGFHLPAATSG